MLQDRVRLWLLCLLVHWSLLAIPVMSFCPPRCKCNEVKLLVLCNSTQILDSVPIMLNPSLKELYLSGNRVKNVYSSFTVYQELRYLDLSYNLISDLGKSSFIMQKKLRVLLLAGNNITQIGSRVFMSLNRLETLDLSINHISFIAREAFLGLLNLKQLNLQSNKLTQVPSFFHLENLLRLNLASNLLTALPELAFSPLTQLQELDLQSNQLYHVPSEPLSELRNLQVIILSHNPITALRPKSFRDLRLLRTLVLSNTPLSYVDRDALRDNVHLTRVIMDNNRQLSFIPVATFASQWQSLAHLSLRSDRISSLEEGTLNLDRIESVDLRDNPLVCNCSLVWLADYLRSSNESLSGRGQVKCHRPASHSGKTLITLSPSDLSCPRVAGELQDILSLVIVLVTVLLLASLIVCVALFCVRRRPDCLRGPRSSSLSHAGISRPIIISSRAIGKSRLDHSLYYPTIINEDFTRDKHYHTMTTSTRTSALSVDMHPPLHYASIANI